MTIQVRGLRRIWPFVVGGVIILVGTCLIAWTVWPRGEPSAPAPDVSTPAPSPVAVTSDVLFLGNAFWGRYTHEYAMKSPLGYAYPFSRLHELQRDDYDAWISGLECPMKASVHMTAAEQEENLQFNCSPDFLPEAKKWFTAFSLANNHTDNQGVDGFEETKEHLDEQGIQYFGHYDPNKLDDICEVVALPVTVQYSDDSTKKELLPVAICAYHGVFRIPSQAAVDEISRYSKMMPVFAMPHMGAEYKPVPDQIKTDFYHRLIDTGADVVLGDHPHWVQSTEAYKGKLIVYSMGNFMFDQNWNPELMRSAAIHTRVTIKEGSLAEWLALGETCRAYHDDCLETAESKGLSRLNPSYQFDAIITQTDRRALTGLAEPSVEQSVRDRLDWDRTMSALDAPYGLLQTR